MSPIFFPCLVTIVQEKSGLAPGLALVHCTLAAGVGLGEEALDGVKALLGLLPGVALGSG